MVRNNVDPGAYTGKDGENDVFSTDLIIDSFHLKGPHKEVPADDMGKGAIASAKFI